MPLTKKEKRQLEHIEESEEKRGFSKKRSKKIARAFVYSRKRKHERKPPIGLINFQKKGYKKRGLQKL